MLFKACARCGNYIQYPNTYCSVCLPIVEEARAKRLLERKRKYDRIYNKTRDKKYLRFYNSAEWRALSSKYMSDKGYKCEGCHKLATEVHHKKPIQTDEGWDLRLDYDNLMAVCIKCHNKDHGRLFGKKYNKS